MAPYRYPLFRALAQQPGIDLTVWFMSRGAKNRRWANPSTQHLGFKYNILPKLEVNYATADLFTYIVNYTFPWKYVRETFDVIVSAGWLDFASQAGFVLSKLLHRRFIIWCESTPNEPSWRRSIAMPIVKTMVGGSDACLAVGTLSKQYLRLLGACEASIFTAFSTVDVDHFRRASSNARLDRDRRKAALGIRRKRVLLYCGQFIERKGLIYLIQAFGLVKQEYEDVALILVGYGPLLHDLHAAVRDAGLADVHILDHVEVGEMPALYALADVFVLPSVEEAWGLVVNEAMACGLPVVVTSKVGAGPDLVREAENGYVVLARDPHGLADRCLRLIRHDVLMNQFSARSAELIGAVTPERAAEQFAAAVQYAMARP